MEYGYGEGLWINGSHWYGDPYHLYSDFTTNFDLSPNPLYIYNDGGQNLYIFYNAVLKPDIQPVPVPEPSCLFLAVCSILMIFFLKKRVLTSR
jgi:hypothetical protein